MYPEPHCLSSMVYWSWLEQWNTCHDFDLSNIRLTYTLLFAQLQFGKRKETVETLHIELCTSLITTRIRLFRLYLCCDGRLTQVHLTMFVWHVTSKSIRTNVIQFCRDKGNLSVIPCHLKVQILHVALQTVIKSFRCQLPEFSVY